jgi:predicted RND superfamily exporter protein
VLIFLFLFLIYRKLPRFTTPVIPIMMMVGWNGIIMFVLGIDYPPMTTTPGSMTIGVASEYTILIMERAYKEMGRGALLIPAITHAGLARSERPLPSPACQPFSDLQHSSPISGSLPSSP